MSSGQQPSRWARESSFSTPTSRLAGLSTADRTNASRAESESKNRYAKTREAERLHKSAAGLTNVVNAERERAIMAGHMNAKRAEAAAKVARQLREEGPSDSREEIEAAYNSTKNKYPGVTFPTDDKRNESKSKPTKSRSKGSHVRFNPHTREQHAGSVGSGERKGTIKTADNNEPQGLQKLRNTLGWKLRPGDD